MKTNNTPENAPRDAEQVSETPLTDRVYWTFNPAPQAVMVHELLEHARMLEVSRNDLLAALLSVMPELETHSDFLNDGYIVGNAAAFDAKLAKIHAAIARAKEVQP